MEKIPVAMLLGEPPVDAPTLLVLPASSAYPRVIPVVHRDSCMITRASLVSGASLRYARVSRVQYQYHHLASQSQSLPVIPLTHMAPTNDYDSINY